MNSDDMTLELFLRDRIKDKGISLKKLSDVSGISLSHIENILRGDFERVPSTPYFRGYLMRLGEVLDFDGEVWWDKIKKEEAVRKSGPADTLPRNRFIRQSPVKILAISAIVLAALIYIIFALPHISGKPVITIVSPQENPFVADTNAVIIQGTVKNADSLYVNGDEATVSSDGSWQKNVLLQEGVNTFDISAKKFLGGTSDVIEQIMYRASASAASSSSPASASTTQGTKIY